MVSTIIWSTALATMHTAMTAILISTAATETATVAHPPMGSTKATRS